MLKIKLFTYLQLIRFPNIFTSVADVLAGYLVVAVSIDFPVLAFLALTSACIYGGGCVLNDFCDVEKDTRERPDSPIPSGRASRLEAFILFFILSAASLLFSILAGVRSFAVALILILLVVFFSSKTKERPVSGPLNMAACRSLNLFLGMSVFQDLSSLGLALLVISFVYVLSLTILSDHEMSGKPGKKIWYAFTGFIFIFIVFGVMLSRGKFSIDALFFMILLFMFIGPSLLKVLQIPNPVNIGRSVKYLVLGIPLLDAVYVAGIQDWYYAIPVAICTPVSIIIARYFYVT